MGEWIQGTFGCFDNCGICIVSYFLPCYRVGKIAETLGDSCMCHALLFFVPLLNIFLMMGHRGRLRERQGIEGDTINDLLCVLCCTLCVLTQEGAECEVINGGMVKDQDIERC